MSTRRRRLVSHVQVDHLMRPARMTDASANWVWDVIFTPFGTTAYIDQNPTVMNIRFPGQWFQLETGLAYNWHRHYDATIGRYMQPDKLGAAQDKSQMSTVSVSTDLLNSSPAIAVDQAETLPSAVISARDRIGANKQSVWRALLRRAGVYGYANQSPITNIDPTGLMISDLPYSPEPTTNQTPIAICRAQQYAFSGPLIDKRYDETINKTHCTYGIPMAPYSFTLEIDGYHSCSPYAPVPF